MNPIVSLLIDGKAVNPRHFAVPEMNLSSARSAMRRHVYEFRLDSDTVFRLLESAYADWVRESREDDLQQGHPQDRLAEAGYPPLEELSTQPDLLKLVLGHYLLSDLFTQIDEVGKGPIHYWMDNVTACFMDSDFIVMSGDCYGRN